MYRDDDKRFGSKRLGLGCMRMSINPQSIREESIETIQFGIDNGIKFLNSGDFYGIEGHNELLIGEAIKGYDREKLYISIKYGSFIHSSSKDRKFDLNPYNLKERVTGSLKRLGVDYIDLYQPARIDIGYPLEDTIDALSDLVSDGYIREIGLSEVDSETLERANKIHPIKLVEVEYSISNRSIEENLVSKSRDLDIGVVAFGIMGFGKLSFFEDDPLVKMINHIAKEKDLTFSQILHGWVYSRGNDILPLSGARTISQIKEALKSCELKFEKEDIERIESSFWKSNIVGPRMPKLIIDKGVIK